MELLQRRQREAQVAKIAHMQEFIDKFRYNANRAALVQSRIKARDKELLVMVDEVVEEASFSFSFPDAGQLGSNVIKLQQVSFGYKPTSNNSSNTAVTNEEVKMLFSNVDLCIEQSR